MALIRRKAAAALALVLLSVGALAGMRLQPALANADGTAAKATPSNSGDYEVDPDSESQVIEDMEEGEEEWIPVEDIFSVLLPTIPALSEGGGAFDYILDPQRLVTATDNAAHGGICFEEGATLFFRNHEDGSLARYSPESDRFAIVNRSTVPAIVRLEAEVTGAEGVAMASDPSFEGEDGAVLYLAITDGEETRALTPGETVCVNMEIPAAESDAYRIVYDEGSATFVYELTEKAGKDGYSGFAEKSFWLVGACGPEEGWNDFNGELPAISVTWSVEPQEDGATRTLLVTERGIEEVTLNGELENDLGGAELAESTREEGGHVAGEISSAAPETPQETTREDEPSAASPSDCIEESGQYG